MEHGAAFNPEQVVEVTAVRTARSYVFHVQDPGAGFRRESLVHAAVGNQMRILLRTSCNAKRKECVRAAMVFSWQAERWMS